MRRNFASSFAFLSSSESPSASAHTGATLLRRLTIRGERGSAGRACRPVAPRTQSSRVATCSCIRFCEQVVHGGLAPTQRDPKLNTELDLTEHPVGSRRI
eukprot:scaffold52297_cov63-Phaeocystis_antarctica.AAC.2